MPKPPRIQGSSSRLRVGRVSEDYGCYAITKVVDQRRRVLATDEIADRIIACLRYMRHEEKIKLFAFSIMPDHLHLSLCLMPGEEIFAVVRDFSKFTSRGINQLLATRGKLWQEGFFDRRIRNREELGDRCEYIEHNPVRAGPVRAGLVASAQQWPYSSAAFPNQAYLDRDWWP